MKTLQQINEEFDKKFLYEGANTLETLSPSEIKTFLQEQIKSVLNQVVPEERKEFGKKYSSVDEDINYGWNDCREQLLNNIKKIIE